MADNTLRVMPVAGLILFSAFPAMPVSTHLKSYETQLKLNDVLLRKFQIAYRNKLARRFPAALIEIQSNCMAVTHCENGVVVSCRVKGKHTSCYSGEDGAICLLEDRAGRINGSNAIC